MPRDVEEDVKTDLLKELRHRSSIKQAIKRGSKKMQHEQNRVWTLCVPKHMSTCSILLHRFVLQGENMFEFSGLHGIMRQNARASKIGIPTAGRTLLDAHVRLKAKQWEHGTWIRHASMNILASVEAGP